MTKADESMRKLAKGAVVSVGRDDAGEYELRVGCGHTITTLLTTLPDLDALADLFTGYAHRMRQTDSTSDPAQLKLF